MSLNLSELDVGATGIVRAFAEGSRAAMRLREMGVLPGTEVRIVRLAPLGDPIEIEVRGFRLSLRKTEAAEILIESDDSTD
ncbi:MAG: ferrous iron transport protein A [Verrucomicrobia bacterium]|nr:MAG: ferrous iron transport protein A [Verrucomicrobiota bacterium]